MPVNSRNALRSVVLPRGGSNCGQYLVIIRKGEDVAYSTYVMHRRRDIYGDDVEVFKPERWEDGNCGENSYSYVPFHGGHRICLGRNFVLMPLLHHIIDIKYRRLCAYRDFIYDCAFFADI